MSDTCPCILHLNNCKTPVSAHIYTCYNGTIIAQLICSSNELKLGAFANGDRVLIFISLVMFLWKYCSYVYCLENKNPVILHLLNRSKF